MSQWPHVPFGDLYGAPSKNGLMAPARVRGTGVALINMREIFALERIASPEMELAPLPDRDPETWLVQPGDLLFARQSLVAEGAGKCAIVAESDVPRTFESHIIRVRLNEKVAEPEFYFNFFRSRLGRQLIFTIVEQVAAAGIRATDLAKLEVPVPPLAEQRRIAETLGALDEKVEVNRRKAELGQDLLRSFYRSWFVEYTPWQNKAPGDWPEGTLRDVVDMVRNPAKAGQYPDRPYVPIDMIPRNSLGLVETRPNSEAQSSLSLFEKDDILLGAMRVYFHRVAVAPFAGITRNTTFVLRPKTPQFLAFCLLVCDDDSTIEYAEATSKGSTMPYAVWGGGLADMPILIPPPEVAAEFQERVRILLEQVRDQMFETQRLTALRDALLPELLSGRFRVPAEGEMR